MAAAAAARLRLQSEKEIGSETLELAGAIDDYGREVRRFRTVRTIIERGDWWWAALGAWPWVAFQDGAVPDVWWREDPGRRSIRQVGLTAAKEAQEVARTATARGKALEALADG